MNAPFSKVAIVGAGALGGYYGARLARAGGDVYFLMRGDLAHVRAHGLRVRTPTEEFAVPRVAAHATAAEIGPCDLVIVTLKATANAELAALLPPLLGPATAVLTLQNGLGNEERIAAIGGAERVLGGICFICVTRVAPGEIDCTAPGYVSLAEFGRPASPRTHAAAQLFADAGVSCRACDRLDEIRWKKLVWNIPFNGLAIAAGGVTTDRLLADPALAAQVRALMEEVAAAAARFGVEISPEFIEKQISATRAMSAYKPSSLIDHLAGRAVEVEAIWGEPLRRAQAAGVALPRLAALYADLRRLTRS